MNAKICTNIEQSKKLIELEINVNTADKVKPKFKVGDYIISNNNSKIIYHITGTGINELGNSDYVCEHVGREKEYNGRIYNMSQDKVDANFRLWTIQDAEEGDVLVNQNGEMPFIFKECKNNHIYCYCGYTNRKDMFFDRFVNSKGKELHWVYLYYEQVYPATKEQRDLLFQKMKEAGYEWDAERKELRKIEQKPAEWSEEDEYLLDYSLQNLAELENRYGKEYGRVGECINWLKSLKGRIQPQPKQE